MKLLHSALTYGDNFLSFSDAFQLYLVSTRCKKLASKYLENYNMFAIYPGPKNESGSGDEKGTYLIQNLNHKKIKQLYLYDYFVEDGIYVQFALQCINIRYLYLSFIYPYISTSLHKLTNLQSIYIKQGLHIKDYTTLTLLPCMNTIRFKFYTEDRTMIVIYHKTKPNNEYMKGSDIILCCDHSFDQDLIQYCANIKEDREENNKQCKIVTPGQIYQYLESSSVK